MLIIRKAFSISAVTAMRWDLKRTSTSNSLGIRLGPVWRHSFMDGSDLAVLVDHHTQYEIFVVALSW